MGIITIKTAQPEPTKFNRILKLPSKFSSFLHDISSPLTLAQLNLDMLRTKLTKSQEKSLMVLLEAAMDGIEIVSKMVITIKKEKKSLDGLMNYSAIGEIDKVLRLFSQKILLEDIQVETDYKDDKLFFGRKTEFSRIMINIINNAIEAMASDNNKRKYMKVETSRNSNHFIVKISDSGKGLTSKEVRGIFKKGYTSKIRGLGLGLSIVSNYMEEFFKGVVICRSQKGFGTSFTLKFPSKKKLF